MPVLSHKGEGSKRITLQHFFQFLAVNSEALLRVVGVGGRPVRLQAQAGRPASAAGAAAVVRVVVRAGAAVLIVDQVADLVAFQPRSKIAQRGHRVDGGLHGPARESRGPTGDLSASVLRHFGGNRLGSQ